MTGDLELFGIHARGKLNGACQVTSGANSSSTARALDDLGRQRRAELAGQVKVIRGVERQFGRDRTKWLLGRR